MRPRLRKSIIKKLALGRRGTYDGEQICLTPQMLALNLNENPAEVLLEIESMTEAGLVCQSFPNDRRFFCLTLKGQRGQPIKFAT